MTGARTKTRRHVLRGRRRTSPLVTAFALLGAAVLSSGSVSQAAVTTQVSLTFDNGSVSQYVLGFQQALQPRGARATFFVSSGSVGVS
ncbi:MAG: hypothetical protein JWN55_1116, partial [Frankiales bacterium]|nr:hypothetical protein [Frankiales bacterium]